MGTIVPLFRQLLRRKAERECLCATRRSRRQMIAFCTVQSAVNEACPFPNLTAPLSFLAFTTTWNSIVAYTTQDDLSGTTNYLAGASLSSHTPMRRLAVAMTIHSWG